MEYRYWTHLPAILHNSSLVLTLMILGCSVRALFVCEAASLLLERASSFRIGLFTQ